MTHQHAGHAAIRQTVEEPSATGVMTGPLFVMCLVMIYQRVEHDLAQRSQLEWLVFCVLHYVALCCTTVFW